MINLHQAIKAMNPDKKVVVQDMLCVEYKCMEQNRFRNFWIECDCLVYCLTGKRIYSSQTQECVVMPGTMMYMKKGGYNIEVFYEEEYCALLFFMPDSFFHNFLQRYPNFKINPQDNVNQHNKIIPLQTEKSLEAYFYSMINYFSDRNEVNKYLLNVKLEELILNIFTQKEYKQLATYLSSLDLDRDSQLRYIMEENFSSNLKLEDFASLCNMSLSTFKRQFTKLYKTPPAKWLSNRRLQFSKRLLKQTDKSVNEISFIAGFESPSHFSRVFKNAFGSNPLKYREKHLDGTKQTFQIN